MKAARLGARDYLLKSQFSLEELLVRIKRCLEGVDSQRPHRGEDAPPVTAAEAQATIVKEFVLCQPA